MKLARPEFLLLGVASLLLLWFFLRRRKRAGLGLGVLLPFEASTPKWKKLLLSLPWFFLYASLFLALLASSQLMLRRKYQKIYLPGIDIMVTLDVSRSMAAQDFPPRSRFEVAKGVVEEFLRGRTADRIGIVAFAGAPLLISPLTLDREYLKEAIEDLRTGEIEDGTAIGLAVAEALSNLTERRTSRVIILITDGVNNKGGLSPLDAAKMAAEAGVKIYTIGVGKEGVASIPIEMGTGAGMVKKAVSVDEETLRKMAEITGGKFFRARDPEALRRVFSEIDALEKKRVEVKTISRYSPKTHSLILLTLYLFAAFLLSAALLREVP